MGNKPGAASRCGRREEGAWAYHEGGADEAQGLEGGFVGETEGADSDQGENRAAADKVRLHDGFVFEMPAGSAFYKVRRNVASCVGYYLIKTDT